MTSIKLPKELRIRISNYFQARYRGKWYDERDVLNWVSSSIKEVAFKSLDCLLTSGNMLKFVNIIRSILITNFLF